MCTRLAGALLRARILQSPDPRREFRRQIRDIVDAGEDTIGADATAEELENELFELDGAPVPDEE